MNEFLADVWLGFKKMLIPFCFMFVFICLGYLVKMFFGNDILAYFLQISLISLIVIVLLGFVGFMSRS